MPDRSQPMKISTALGEALKQRPGKANRRPELGPHKPLRTLAGSFDGIDGRLAEGWALDERASSQHCIVQIFDDDRLLGETVANLFRQDLLDADIGDGCHSFRFILPLELFDGRSHRIVARIKQSDFQLNGSPQMLSTHPLPIEQAFPLQRAVTAIAPPLTDVQFTMLRALTAISETLVAQGKTLSALAEHIVRLAPNGGIALPAPDTFPVVTAVAQPHGPLLPAALAHTRGKHDFLFFSVIDWDFRTQRPQHLAREIAKLGYRVFYISKTFEEISGEARFRIKAQPAEGVFEIVLRCRAPLPNIYAGFTEEAQIADIFAALTEAAATLRLQAPVGIVQFPSWYPVAVGLPGMLLVHDCLDQVSGFNNVAPRVIAHEEQMIQKADCVVVTSDHLARFVGRHRAADMVRNAGDVAYFSRPPADIYRPRSRPVIGYYGAIADWFDIDLVLYCARKHPEWQVVLIGASEGADVSEVRRMPNIALLGEKPYGELTRYLYAFDVCIIPFKLVELTKATNPVKVYEYLCAGKPVVAVDLPELRLLPKGLVHLARTHAAFEGKIVAALKEAGPEPARQRRTWASSQSWAVRARQFVGVADRQSPKVSVVVLCYDNLQFTRACLESVIAHSDYPGIELICVDNGSTDETAGYLSEFAARCNFVRVISNARNIGFAAGNNVGLRAATGAVTIILNNDTYVTTGWIRDLIRPLLLDQGIGMTGPLTNMIGNEQKIAINYANMEEMAAASAAFLAKRRRRIFETESLAFFCAAIRNDVIAKVGYLDESYGTGFFEDDDYCMRVRKAGYRLAICDDVFVHHHLSASFEKLAATERAALMRRNRKLFEQKWGAWKPHAYRAEPGFGE